MMLGTDSTVARIPIARPVDENGSTMSVTATPPLDREAYDEVMGHVPTGIVLLTAMSDDDSPLAMILGSFGLVSSDPPIVSFMPTKTSSSWGRMRALTSFCVNVLAADQADVCQRFSMKDIKDKFAGMAWERGPKGLPVLEGVIATIECTVRSRIDGGDHDIILADVTHARLHNDKLPLLYFQGGLGRFATLAIVMGSDAEIIGAARAADIARPEIQRLATDLGVECAILTRSGDAAVVVATAGGVNVAPEGRIGARLPLVPPLGALMVSHAPPEEAERWLSRRHRADQFEAEDYRRRLEEVRHNGWSIDINDQYSEDSFYDALRHAADGEVTPAQFRALRAMIAQISTDHATTSLSDSSLYDVGGLMVPIFGVDGSVDMVLRVSQFSPCADAEQVRRWIARSQDTASRISTALHEFARGTDG